MKCFLACEVIANERDAKSAKDLARVDKERKDAVQKIQSMHNETRDLKSKLADYEAGRSANVKKLEDSLTAKAMALELL